MLLSRFCKTGQHDWCANRDHSETHCGCGCHDRQRALHAAEVALRTAAVDFAALGLVKTSVDREGLRANRKLLHAARRYAKLAKEKK